MDRGERPLPHHLQQRRRGLGRQASGRQGPSAEGRTDIERHVAACLLTQNDRERHVRLVLVAPDDPGLKGPPSTRGTFVGHVETDPLKSFTPQVREWFARSFASPTDAQTQAWPAIAGGEHVLVSAPTGSGKTLAAFLWGLDRLVANPLPEGERRTRLVYVSPLKALSYDVEKNLRGPLMGIGGDVT